MGVFSINYLNSHNFVRWRQATGVPLTGLGEATLAGPVTSFPNNYIKNDSCYFPKMILGSELAVYANLTGTASDLDFADWACVFADRFGNVNSGHGTFAVTQDDFGGGTFRWYLTQTPSAANFVAGEYYRLVIYNTSTMNVKYVSNFIVAVASTDADKYAYTWYRSGSSLDNFNYTDLTSFRNKIALDLNLTDDQPELEFSDYPEVTTGEIQTTRTYKKLTHAFTAFQFDYEARRALEHVASCTDILINTNTVERSESPVWEANRRSTSLDGSFKVYIQNYSTVNVNGYDG